MNAKIAHVLVVDDDPMIRMLLEAFLETLGCRATICDDGALAAGVVERAANDGDPVDLILIDLRLGAVSGLEWCRSLRDAGAEVPIVCISGDVGSTDPRLYDEAGFDGAMSKPLSLSQLDACIAQYA